MMRAAEEERDGLVEAVLQSQHRSEQKCMRKDHALGSQLNKNDTGNRNKDHLTWPSVGFFVCIISRFPNIAIPKSTSAVWANAKCRIVLKLLR